MAKGVRTIGGVSIQATVKAVAMETRTVTLVDPQGETKTLKVDDQVQNLTQIKPGDTITAYITEDVVTAVERPR